MALNVKIKQKTTSGVLEMHPYSKANNIYVSVSGNSSIPSPTGSPVQDLQDLVDLLGDLAFDDSINIPSSDSISSNSSETLATSKAVYLANIGAVHVTGAESINGIKTFNDAVRIGDAELSYDANTDTLTISKYVAPTGTT